jgi:predicted transcriptional regulator of viral defense system
MADPARTVVDVLDDPRLSGGIRLATEILAAYLQEGPPATLIEYAERLGNRTVFKRLGYLGEVLGADPDLLASCEQVSRPVTHCWTPPRPEPGSAPDAGA